MKKNRLTKTQVEKAIAKQERFLAHVSGSTNPQTVKMADQARGTLEALNAVLDAMNGNLVFLNILSDDFKHLEV